MATVCSETSEFVDIKTHSNIDAIFANPKGYPRLMGVLGNVGATQSAVCPIGAAADQKRRAGRMLFAANIDAYLSRLGRAVQDVQKKEVGGKINLHLFCGLAGGTGSGSIIDAITQTRKWMFEHNISEKNGFSLTVFCQIPEATPQPNWDTGRYKANGYGALLELNNLFTSHYNMEWGTRVSTPPYDVSTNIETGRIYLTYDNPTPQNVKNGNIPQELNIAGGLILYTNKNDFGYSVNDPIQLAGLVSDLYTAVYSLRWTRWVRSSDVSIHSRTSATTATNTTRLPTPKKARHYPCAHALSARSASSASLCLRPNCRNISPILGSSAPLQLKYNN